LFPQHPEEPSSVEFCLSKFHSIALAGHTDEGSTRMQLKRQIGQIKNIEGNLNNR